MFRSFLLALYTWFLLARLASANQLSLPILSDPAFHLLSGDTLVEQQLGSWGIKLGPISVDLGIDLSALTDFLSPQQSRQSKRDVRRSRITQEEKRLLGLGLLNLNLNLGGSSTTGSAKPTTTSKALLNLDIAADLSSTSWGQADGVARGERGDTEWYTYISLGTPPQSIPVLPDTGSSDLFVFGPDCSSCSLSNHTSFSAQSSSTYTNLTSPWSFEYADGSGASGYASQDLVAFGGSDRAMSSNMEFAIANLIGGSDSSQSARSGVLGLGLDGMSTISPSPQQGSTLFSRLIKSKSLSQDVLSIRLIKGQQSQGVVSQEGSGQYTLGGIEESYIAGGEAGLAWTPVLSSNYWGIAMDDMLVGTASILSSDNSTPRRAIIDTGTTLIITSNSASAAIHAQIPKSYQDASSSIWYIPCTTAYPSAQNIFFSIGGRKFGVPVEDLAWKVSTQYSGMCVSGVQGGMSSFTVLGDMFIKNHYVVLSYGSDKEDNIQVGLGDRTDVAPIL